MADDIEKLVLSISADTNQLRRAMERLEKDSNRSAKAVERQFTDMGTAVNDNLKRTFSTVEGGARRAQTAVTQSLGAQKAATQQLQFQLNDIATQLASGTSPFQVMAQQGGQVVQALTGSGGVLGALRLVGAAALNPFTLATVAITTLAGVATAYFKDTAKDAEDANKKLEEHRAAVKAALDAWDGAPPKELVAYNQELERLSDLEKQRAALKIIISDGLKPVNEAAAAAAETFDQLFARLETRNVDAKVLSDLRRDFDRMKDAIDGGNASATDILPIFTRLQDLEASIGTTKGFSTLKQQIQDLLPLVDKANAKLEGTRRIADNLGANFRVDMGDDVGTFLRDRSRPTIPLPDTVNETPEPRVDPFFADALRGSDNAAEKLQREAERAADKLNDAIARQTSVAVDAATTLLGKSENSDASTINAFLKRGGVDLDAATSAWCAAFVNSALAQVGVKGTGSNVATDFLNFGKGVNLSDIQRGDILVDANGRRAGQTGGHVGFATGQLRVTAEGISQIEMLSGNASDKVSTDWVNASEVVARRATDAFQVPTDALQNLTQQSAEAKAATDAQTAAVAAQKQAYDNLGQIGTTALNGIATALADGKIEGEEVLQIIMQIVQQLLTMPRAGGAGGLFGGLFGGGGTGSGLNFFPPAPAAPGAGGLLGGLLIPGILHDGGVVGKDGYGHNRAVSASAFAGARRFHKGLLPDEFPAILQRGEIVVPKGGYRGGAGQDVHVTVGVSADNNGNLQPFVESVSQKQAKDVTRAGLKQYDGELKRSFGARMANAQARQL
ncbi:phage tail length tape measure family protein [Mesorhizobium yinganensis]|uniref:phage tail length tape measure family protein n=1 Tax=Mesorhizobium yinganensis TaxID=3157707 RepID=UPI0032B75507